MSASLASPFTVHCPSCETGFPVDPAKVPSDGIYAVCSQCERTFLVSRPEDSVAVADPGGPGQEGADVAHGADEPAAGSEAAEITFEDSTFATEPAEEPPAGEDLGGDPAETFGEAASEGGFSLDDSPAEEPAGSAPPREEAADQGLDLEDEPFEFASPEGTGEPPASSSEPSSPSTSSGADAPESEAEAPPAPETQEGAGSGNTTGFEDLRGLASEAVSEGAGTHSGGSTLSGGAERFGRRDPQDRAKRLARVLVSDIIAYYPERFQESRARGTVKEDFEAEVQKSWKEYVDQVGQEMAESTPYFTEALNEILAGGQEVF